MKTIAINAERSYEVVFVESWQNELIQAIGDRTAAIIYPTSLKSYLKDVPTSIHRIEVPDGESQKSIENFGQVLNSLAELGISRNGVIVGLGGGATTDLAGFAAASYLRGVSWIAIPTSLAAMVDASIGGKTGINLESGKNLAGAFYSPARVIIDESFLFSLSERDLRAGMAEVAKCGFIADVEILDLIERDWRKNLSELIYRAVLVKANVVSRDFRESFEREILNYGHTLGHAVEKDSQFEMRHGESVSVGLIYAAALSKKFSGLSDADYLRHITILQSLELPITYERTKWPNLISLMQKDKKKKDSLRFVTLSKLGSPVRLENIEEKSLQSIYEEVVGR